MQTFLNIITVTAFVLSFGQLIAKLYAERVKLNLVIIDYVDVMRVWQFYFLLENKSRLPISVTRIRLLFSDGTSTDCFYESRQVKSICGRQFTTVDLPINLFALGATSGYLEFRKKQGSQLEVGMPLTFEISTNRGKIAQNLVLQNTSGYLHTTSQ